MEAPCPPTKLSKIRARGGSRHFGTHRLHVAAPMLAAQAAPTVRVQLGHQLMRDLKSNLLRVDILRPLCCIIAGEYLIVGWDTRLTPAVRRRRQHRWWRLGQDPPWLPPCTSMRVLPRKHALLCSKCGWQETLRSQHPDAAVQYPPHPRRSYLHGEYARALRALHWHRGASRKVNLHCRCAVRARGLGAWHVSSSLQVQRTRTRGGDRPRTLR